MLRVKLLRSLVALMVLCVLAVWLVPQVRVGLLTVLLAPHFFPGALPRPLVWATPRPEVGTAVIPGTEGHVVADVYRPAGCDRCPAMILFLGVNPLPRSDPQVTTLAEGIARTGIVTVVAEARPLLEGNIHPDAVGDLVTVFQWVEQDGDVDPNHIGFAGFCIGAVLEILAAEDERIADHVAYVNAFSVYADAMDLLRAILTESQPGPNGAEPWMPSDLTKMVFFRHMIGLLQSESDRLVLSQALLEQRAAPLDPAALSPQGGRMLALLRSSSPDEVNRFLATLPPNDLAALNSLSPARRADRLRAHVFLMHDVDDTYLPVAGARQLAASLPPAARVRFTEFELFSHVVPGRVEHPVKFMGEMVKLLSHIYGVMLVAHGLAD
ncbi:MAG TPA: hypothetical protein VFC51_15240 [Chloroflexota bacterium]|nr:hypothetical protein [Chloroflexota bacterium]